MEKGKVAHESILHSDGKGFRRVEGFVNAGGGEKRPLVDDAPWNQHDGRSLPHKKRRQPAVNEQVLIDSKCLLKTLSEERSSPDSTLATPSADSASKPPKKKADAAWMHRLYPFDGPSIEEFTPLFENVDVHTLVEEKLAQMKDRWLARVVKAYYEEVIGMDHNEYKNADRPPIGTPEDIRPFLLSRHQLKSFNSDFLRSALRKTRVNRSFCLLLRSTKVKGVPEELRNLGNEAFARSIRTHQIIAFFSRYFALFQTKFPGRSLDLQDNEHKILLDCLRDIVRRVSAKKVIQQSVVSSSFAAAEQSAPKSPPLTDSEKLEDDSFSQGDTSNDETLETAAMTDTEEKENKTEYLLDQSFESTKSSPLGSRSPAFTIPFTPQSRESIIAYDSVLSVLSNDARQAVEAMVESLKRKVMEDARKEVCQRSFEEGRKAGFEEGRALGRKEAAACDVGLSPQA